MHYLPALPGPTEHLLSNVYANIFTIAADVSAGLSGAPVIV